MAATKKAKTKAEVKAEPPVIVFEAEGAKPVLPEPKDPVIERLDRIIELLKHISAESDRIPFKGIDFGKIL